MSLCPENYTVIDLGVRAAERALERWNRSLSDIGLIAVGTESGCDLSRPLSAWIAEKLQLKGQVRSYEVKHACYGGTLALRQAVEWKLSGVAGNKAALVIATDIATYAQGDPGEPTQGAGAVAMIIDEPLIAKIHPQTQVWSEPVFDFWRPLHTPYPLVDGQFSLQCYQQAALACFQQLLGEHEALDFLSEFAALCFHVPFAKMVKKAVTYLGQHFGWETATTEAFMREKITAHMQWNKACGNAYSAALWISVAHALCGLEAQQKLLAFSYGSGYGAELLTLSAGPLAKAHAWSEDIEIDLKQRRLIDANEYSQLRAVDKLNESF